VDVALVATPDLRRRGWVIVDDHSSDQSTLEALREAVDRRDLHCSPTPLLHGRRVLPFGSLDCTTLPEVI
jgi:hypothetical protein